MPTLLAAARSWPSALLIGVGIAITPTSAAGAEHAIQQWLTWRGARALPRFDVEPSGCVEVRTGDRGEVGLSCVEIVHEGRGKDASHVYRVVVVQRVYVVRLGRVEKVFDQSVSVVPLDPEGDGPSTIVATAVVFATDGRSAEVLDDPRAEHGCTQASARIEQQLKGRDPHDPDAVTRRWASFDRDLVRKVCRGVGRYAWTGDRFAWVSRASPPSDPKSPPATPGAR